MRNNIVTDQFVQSLRDYSHLLNRNYPRKSVLKLVGDRYQLNTFQRILLSRGIFPEEAVLSRREKSTENISGKEICVDTYNVLFTISNYLLGRIVFISNDYFLRDAGEVYGKLYKDAVFIRAIDLMMDYLGKKKVARVEFYIDKPVSFSAELAGRLREILLKGKIPGDAFLDRNPDAILKAIDRGIVASSDSDILDGTNRPVADLAHLILKDQFSLRLPDLGSIPFDCAANGLGTGKADRFSLR